jgi:DNA-binding NarL/FixJ family response regulator
MVNGVDGIKPAPADLELLELLARGETIEAIAHRLQRSDRTVRRRVRAIGDRLGVETTVEAVVCAVRQGWI